VAVSSYVKKSSKNQNSKKSFSIPSLSAFADDLASLRKEINQSIGLDDFKHLKYIEKWGRAATTAGYMSAWICPNPFSAVAISYGNLSRWMVAHHVLHGGYDRIPGIPKRYSSKGFAKGLRRYIDWPDWMTPEAWNYEHNVLHHFNTGEEADPDLVEANFSDIHESKIPFFLRYLILGGFMVTWKASYYAPNTLHHLNLQAEKVRNKAEKKQTAKYERPGYLQNLTPFTSENSKLWTQCYLPYAALRFGLTPALFMPLGPWASFSVLANSVMAELLTNLHSFVVIVPNHTGDDLYRFDAPPQAKGEYAARQVLGSANFACGNDRIDMLHGWLNYQIEHHIWPDLPMLKYQQYQKRVQALCEKHGIPYTQESVWKRLKKTMDIAVGKTKMLRTTGLAKRIAS
jgi:fatty acid desaturase